MFSRIGAAVGAVVIAAGATWYLNPFQNQSGNDALLSQVPADTVYFFGTSGNHELAKLMQNYPVGMGTPSQQATMDSIEDMGADNPAIAFFFELFLKPSLSSTTAGELINKYGLAAGGPGVFYSHGIVPVMRAKLADALVFDQLVEAAAQKSTWTYTTETFEGLTLKRWQLSELDDETSFDFVIARDDNFATLTLLNKNDDPATVKERLGLSSPKNNLASSGAISAMREKYGFQPYMDGYIHFENLTKQLLDLNNSDLGRDMVRYLPADSVAKLESLNDEALKADILSIANAVPRWVFGYKKLEVKGNTMLMDFDAILEINNTVVTDELVKLRGHLPKHVLSVSNKLFSFGAAVDSSNLVLSLTNLWGAFVQADFKSDAFKQAQEQAKQGNPAMLGMFMGMVQGVKGAGLSVFDVELDAEFNPSKVDALFSVAAEQPSTTAEMAKMLPPLANLELPDDGTAVPVVLPMVPAELELKAAIKGKHIAVFIGDKASAEAEKLSNEALEANGLIATGFNYRKLSTVMDALPISVTGAQSCAAKQELREFMRQMQMDFMLNYDTGPNGLVMGLSGSVEALETAKLNVGGNYKIEYLNDDCEWEYTGMEVINSDGSGSYTEKDEKNSCELYNTKYTWEQQNTKLSFKFFDTKTRLTCDEELKVEKDQADRCYMLNVEDQSFQCLFSAGTEEAFIYRYNKI
ncbi:hypothetical protein [Agaribacterium sp. ZY112]|uniref:hypothetical protein n=1 Tax=Agaribacterium sp. ZY112 TaxID=3233574 RepID=UPI003523FB2D